MAMLLTVACSGDSDTADPPDATTTTQAGSATTTTAVVAGPVPEGPLPEVEGPVTGGEYGVPYNPAPPELLDDAGYVEEEYFLAGDAGSYAMVGERTADGRWDVTSGPSAPYRTRIIVRRPAAEADFNGTVVVEWLNVSAGRDSDPEWGMLHPYLTANGMAYVGVSAQETGIEGGGGVLEIPGVPEIALAPLKQWDPERYATLDHPGDAHSYDIFSQVGRLVRSESPVLGGYPVNRVIGAGESQSASRLLTYVNAVQPELELFDGLMITGRPSSAPTLAADEEADPNPSMLRTDLDQPVLAVQAETDVTFLRSYAARQDDTDSVVTWEVAGAAHADAGFIRYGAASGSVWLPGVEVDFAQSCGGPLNEGYLQQVSRAGLAALDAWIDGTPPGSGEPLTMADPSTIARDDLGIALGGIRTPSVDAPVWVVSGAPRPEASVFCALFGSTEPLPPGTVADLYADQDAYVQAVTESADAAVADGFLLPEDRDAMVAAAEDEDLSAR